MNRLFTLFQEFISDESIREELLFCVKQSQVEKFIVLKFSFWLSQNYNHEIIMNTIELDKIDFILMSNCDVWYVEFGHAINLIKHGRNYINKKVIDDIEKLKKKISVTQKTRKLFSNNFNQHIVTISLFSDFHVVKTNSGKHYAPVSVNDRHYGTLVKYGGKKAYDKYFANYQEELRSNGFNEKVLEEQSVSIWWKVIEHEFGV
jgi:hypothetical protein